MARNLERVLAIDPGNRGFGFVVMEGPNELVDWGLKFIRSNENARFLEKVEELVWQYEPDWIVCENVGCTKARRGSRAQAFVSEVSRLCSMMNVRNANISKEALQKAFDAYGADTKESFALAVIRQLPGLNRWFPRHRKGWMSEDQRMQIFDAAELALTFYEARQTPGISLSNLPALRHDESNRRRRR